MITQQNFEQRVADSCLISVIVPIYNAGQTLPKCLNSLLEQSLSDFEIILIDDGSMDSSGTICDEYAVRDNRIRVFHQLNQGVSASRQRGIDNAKGVYTIHVDPDDWVEPTMLEDLYQKALENEADMVICDFFIESYKGQKYIKQQPSALDHITVQKELFQQLHGSCCNKLVKRSCYSNGNVKFPEGISFCEDEYVICALLMRDIKIAYLPMAYYHYVRNDEDSLSRKYTRDTYYADVRLRDFFDELFKDSSYKQFVHKQKTLSMMTRAFYGGANVFSSLEFRHLFKKDSHLLSQSKSPPFERFLLQLSCIGFYQPVRKIVHILIVLKHNLKKNTCC